MGRLEERRPLGRHRRRWKDNKKLDLQEVGGGGMDWINLAQDRGRGQEFVNVVMKIQIPQIAGNFLTSCGSDSF